jgi:beta-glucosidase
MDRRDALKLLASGALAGYCLPYLKAQPAFDNALLPYTASDFGNFTWGAATAAYQIEGAWNSDGKGESVWDRFSHESELIKDESNGNVACDFYHLYNKDITLLKSLGFNAFRFSLSWPRILPQGIGKPNPKGIDFYNRVIDTCLENGITPWVNLYHWDLPQALEEKDGWVNRDIIGWFEEYTNLCVKSFGDRVNKWIVLNEPLAFTSLGYGLGIHAPGRKGLSNLLPAIHHAALCQSAGARVIRDLSPNASIGSTFSCSPITPKNDKPRNINAAKRLDALFNRLFIEPAMGMGYPVNELPLLKRMEKYMKPEDEKNLPFNFDFIGLQNYFRIVGKFSFYPPSLWANEITPEERHAPTTEMKWEVYPEGMYQILKQFSKYPVKELVVTENGAAFNDTMIKGEVNDTERIAYYQSYIENVLKAKKEGVNVTGYFAWTLLDNFEWAEGFDKRFGLVYVDFKTLERTPKNSAKWFQNFLVKKF